APAGARTAGKPFVRRGRAPRPPPRFLQADPRLPGLGRGPPRPPEAERAGELASKSSGAPWALVRRARRSLSAFPGTLPKLQPGAAVIYGLLVMRVIRHLAHRPERLRRAVLTLGNFDGAHLGHQAIIRRAVARAREVSGQAVA